MNTKTRHKGTSMHAYKNRLDTYSITRKHMTCEGKHHADIFKEHKPVCSSYPHTHTHTHTTQTATHTNTHREPSPREAYCCQGSKQTPAISSSPTDVGGEG